MHHDSCIVLFIHVNHSFQIYEYFKLLLYKIFLNNNFPEFIPRREKFSAFTSIFYDAPFGAKQGSVDKYSDIQILIFCMIYILLLFVVSLSKHPQLPT
jgi:hypothetical protein